LHYFYKNTRTIASGSKLFSSLCAHNAEKSFEQLHYNKLKSFLLRRVCEKTELKRQLLEVVKSQFATSRRNDYFTGQGRTGGEDTIRVSGKAVSIWKTANGSI
jgi:hypothetical protein